MWLRPAPKMVDERLALKGRDAPLSVPAEHFILGSPLKGPWPGMALATFGMGCFWGAERLFWTQPGVVNTYVGYAGGFTPNPTYKEVCSGRTGHTEIVGVVYDPTKTSYEALLKVFFENHDPTQGFRQGNDVGTQYRSAIYAHDGAQLEAAQRASAAYAERLQQAGFGAVTTEIAAAGPTYFAEEYHQQYLAKNPNGYCGIGGTGVSCPEGLGV